MIQKNSSRILLLFVFAMTLASFQFWRTEAQAQSSYFTSRGCVDCHSAPTTATCAGCHFHSGTLTATKNKTTSYAPGETVTITLTASGARTGWIGARLYNQNGAEVARSTGNQSGMGGATLYPAVLSAPAPAAAGTYTWRVAYMGNDNGSGAGDIHSEKSVNVSVVVAAAPVADTTAPVVGTFAIPATATTLTVPVTSLTATDNVAVTGYMVNKVATAPTAAALGWSATAPTSVTAVAGANTFYAWAKDAAGNVSLARTASVTVTLAAADITKPVIGTFTIPATATTLTVPVTSLTATDNVAVTGYMVNKVATAPTAAAVGWSATAPTSVTAVAGANTFYAWAKDAAGNVSLAKTASVTVTVPVADITKPTLTISALAGGSYTNKVTLNISGIATDQGGVQSVTVNGQPVVLNADGTFSAAVTLTTGANTITVVATDKAGNQQSNVRTITFDPAAPVLSVTAPADNSSSAQSFVTVTGTVNETSTVTVTDNNGTRHSAAMTGGQYSATINLVSGVNTITITATDLAGNTVSAKRTVTYAATSALTLAVTRPVQDMTTTENHVKIIAKVSGAVGYVTVKVTVNGITYLANREDGYWKREIEFKVPGTYRITVTAKDEAGNSSSVTRNVIYVKDGSDEDDHDDEHDDD